MKQDTKLIIDTNGDSSTFYINDETSSKITSNTLKNKVLIFLDLLKKYHITSINDISIEKRINTQNNNLQDILDSLKTISPIWNLKLSVYTEGSYTSNNPYVNLSIYENYDLKEYYYYGDYQILDLFLDLMVIKDLYKDCEIKISLY